eukprot:EG_transcript_6050
MSTVSELELWMAEVEGVAGSHAATLGRVEQAVTQHGVRLDALRHGLARLLGHQRRQQQAVLELEAALGRERARRRAAEEELAQCREERDEFKSEVIDLRVERQALRCQVEEQRVRLQQTRAPPRGTLPKLVSCRHQVPYGSKRYEDVVNMLHFIGENISLDRCAAMELQGRLVLHEDVVTLGRVLQWKLDFKKLDRLYISIPAEEADAFIGLVKRVIQNQRSDIDGAQPGPNDSLPPVDAETIGQIAAQWKVIADANVEGAAPTVYILNEVTRRAIIIGDWPQSPYSPNSAGMDYSALYCAYRAPEGAVTRRVSDLSQFLAFVAANISLAGVVLFEPARTHILLQDRQTYAIHLGRFRRYRLNADGYDGLFLSVPEEDAVEIELAVRAVLRGVPAEDVAQRLSGAWRALSPLQHGRRTYVLNEETHRVLILDCWPDDSVLDRCPAPRVLESTGGGESATKDPVHLTEQGEAEMEVSELVAPPPSEVHAPPVPGTPTEVPGPQPPAALGAERPREPVGAPQAAPRPNYHYSD